MPPDMHPYLDSNPEVIINEPEFFQDLGKLLSESDPKVVTNYIIWRYTSSWAYQLDERFDDIHQTFLKAFIGRQRKSPRWKDCNSAANSRMSYASGAMYVRRFFDKQDREAAVRMVEDLKEAFREMILDNDWMEESTRRYALEKALEMQSLIGFPDFIYNDTALDEYYENVGGWGGGDYLNNDFLKTPGHIPTHRRLPHRGAEVESLVPDQGLSSPQ